MYQKRKVRVRHRPGQSQCDSEIQKDSVYVRVCPRLSVALTRDSVDSDLCECDNTGTSVLEWSVERMHQGYGRM